MYFWKSASYSNASELEGNMGVKSFQCHLLTRDVYSVMKKGVVAKVTTCGHFVLFLFLKVNCSNGNLWHQLSILHFVSISCIAPNFFKEKSLSLFLFFEFFEACKKQIKSVFLSFFNLVKKLNPCFLNFFKLAKN